VNNNNNYNQSSFPPYQPGPPFQSNNYDSSFNSNSNYYPPPSASYDNQSNYPPYQPPPPQTQSSTFDNYPSNYPSYQPTAPAQFNTNQSTYPPYQPPQSSYDNPSSYPSYQQSVSPPAPVPLNNYPVPSSNTNIYPTLPTNQQYIPNNNHNNYLPVAPQVYTEGTLKPYQPFNPQDDAAKLYKAMKGFGTDEKSLIEVLCKRTNSQRQEIALMYKTGYGKDLLQNIKSETSGNFELMFKALLYRTPIELEAHDLHDSIAGLGTNEESLIDIMCTKTNAEMQLLKQTYRQMYNRDLEREVGGDVSGYFKRLLTSLAAGHRSDNFTVDSNKAIQQANELYHAGAKKLGTDEVTFNRIFSMESFPQLNLIFDEYKKVSGGHDIERAIRSEMSGSVEKAFLALVDMARNPAGYYARRLYESMAGAGTRDRALIRIIVLRSEIDMVQIKAEFQRKYKKTLESFIRVNI
jgi:annexin A7/11